MALSKDKTAASAPVLKKKAKEVMLMTTRSAQRAASPTRACVGETPKQGVAPVDVWLLAQATQPAEYVKGALYLGTTAFSSPGCRAGQQDAIPVGIGR